MFKKIRKLLQEDLTQRYREFEDRYLRFENKMYKTLEERLNTLEQRFDDLANVLSGNASKNGGKGGKKSKTEQPRPEQPSAAPETPSQEETPNQNPDDLKRLRGLGKTMEEKLQAQGITGLRQLAHLTEKQIQALEEHIPGFAVRYQRNDWKKQAEDLLKGE